jgi:hypothetical protein
MKRFIMRMYVSLVWQAYYLKLIPYRWVIGQRCIWDYGFYKYPRKYTSVE